MAIPEGRVAYCRTLLRIGAASFGTINADTGMRPSFRGWIDIDATASILEAETCSPKDETEMCS